MGRIVGQVTLGKGLNATFMKAYETAESPAEVSPLILQTSSTSNQEDYGWLGNVPSMEEWKDNRQRQGLIEFEYSIPNKHFEASIDVDRNAAADDQLGAVKTRVADLAKKAKIHPRKLFFNALIAGTSDLCYDGQAFFSASHAEGESGTQTNLYTGTGVTVATLKADFIGARAQMRALKDDKGEPMNEGEMDLYVVCHPSLEGAFDELLGAKEISGSTNTLVGAAKKIVSSRFTDVNDWYLMDASGTIKPIIQQNRQGVQFDKLEGDSDQGFHSRQYSYGVDYRVGFGYGLWQKAVKVTNT